MSSYTPQPCRVSLSRARTSAATFLTLGEARFEERGWRRNAQAGGADGEVRRRYDAWRAIGLTEGPAFASRVADGFVRAIGHRGGLLVVRHTRRGLA
jgi:hypothetical protein